MPPRERCECRGPFLRQGSEREIFEKNGKEEGLYPDEIPAEGKEYTFSIEEIAARVTLLMIGAAFSSTFGSLARIEDPGKGIL